MNLEGTAGLLRRFPELGEHLHSKTAITTYFGEHTGTCDLILERRRGLPTMLRVLGHEQVTQVVHVDRVALDNAIHAKVTTSSFCEHIDAAMTSIDFDDRTDRVSSIGLENGIEIEPSFLFDATNHRRAVAKAAGLDIRYLSGVNRVVYSHRRRGDGHTCDAPSWLTHTTLLRLEESIDGIDGIAWCIPIGRVLSVGISVNPGSAGHDDDYPAEEVLRVMDEAYHRRGVPYRDWYPATVPATSLRHRYFTHGRVSGDNWLLVGPSGTQIWFMSSSGVGTCLAAAKVAPAVVRGSKRAAQRYQRYMSDLVESHADHSWLSGADPSDAAGRDLQRVQHRLLRANVRRFLLFTDIDASALPAAVSRLFFHVFRAQSLSNGFCTATVRSGERYCEFNAPEPSTHDHDSAAEDEALIQHALAIISGECRLTCAADVFHEDVRLHLDDVSVVGRDKWQAWVHFLKSRPGFETLRARSTGMEHAGPVTEVAAMWQLDDGSTSRPCPVRYRIEDGRIVEVWSHRDNYDFIVGRWIRSRVTTWALFAYAWWLDRDRRRIR